MEPFICGPASKILSFLSSYWETLYCVELQKLSRINIFHAWMVADTFLLVLHVYMIFFSCFISPLYLLNTCCPISIVSLTGFLVCFLITEISRGQGLEVQIQKDVSVSNCQFLLIWKTISAVVVFFLSLLMLSCNCTRRHWLPSKTANALGRGNGENEMHLNVGNHMLSIWIEAEDSLVADLDVR